MRKSFNGLSGIVTNLIGRNSRDGDAYVFINKSRNMMKVLRREEGGMVIYAISLDMGRMRLPESGAPDVLSSKMDSSAIVEMVQSALCSPYVRRLKFLSSRF